MTMQQWELGRNRIISDRTLERDLTRSTIRHHDPAHGMQQMIAWQLTEDVMYLPILKCASTWMADQLSLHNLARNTSRTAKHAVLIVRDPIERWITGMSTYLSIAEDLSDLNRVNVYNYLDRKLKYSHIPAYDSHTVAYTAYLRSISVDSISLIDMQSAHSVMEKITGLTLDPTPKNTLNSQLFTQFVQPVVEQLAREHRDKLEQYYLEDRQLLATANWLNHHDDHECLWYSSRATQ